MDIHRILFYILGPPVILILSRVSQSDALFVDGASYLGCFKAPPFQEYVITANNTVENCIAYCQMTVNKYAYAGVAYGDWCACGVAGTDYGRVQDRGECRIPCSGNQSLYCGGVGSLSIFDLLPQDLTTRRQLEKTTSVMAISTNSVSQPESSLFPPSAEKGATETVVLGILFGSVVIYAIIVSALLYLSRRTVRSLKCLKKSTAQGKQYIGVDPTTLDRHSYQGIYLSPNGEERPTSLEHSYISPNGEEDQNNSYQIDTVVHVRGRQATQGVRGDPKLDDQDYVIPAILID